MSPPDTRSPAPRANAGNRAEVVRYDETHSTQHESPEGLAAQFIARKYRLTLPVARLVCDLAAIGARTA